MIFQGSLLFLYTDKWIYTNRSKIVTHDVSQITVKYVDFLSVILLTTRTCYISFGRVFDVDYK